MKINLGAILQKLPQVIDGAMTIADHFKTPGVEKKAAVLASIPESIDLLELGLNRDILNDAAVMELVGAYIDAMAAVKKAKAALTAGILAKHPQTEGIIVP